MTKEQIIKKLPGDKSFECIFKIIKNGPKDSWYESGFLGQYFLGIYSAHHSEDTNILLTSKRLVENGETDASDCGWAYASDAKVIGWTKITPPPEYRAGLIEA